MNEEPKNISIKKQDNSLEVGDDVDSRDGQGFLFGMQYSGPLPHEAAFERYERTLPGAADRILTYTEKEQNFRHQATHKELKFAFISETIGQILAFVSMSFLIFGAIFMASHGHDLVAGAFVGTAVVGVIGKFIDGRKSNKD